MDDFSNHPRSISEIKSDKTGSAAHAHVRDTLIQMLRDIDRGDINPACMLIIWRSAVDEDGEVDNGFIAASPDLVTTMGMLTLAQMQVYESAS